MSDLAISRAARDRYAFHSATTADVGAGQLAGLAQLRDLAESMNRRAGSVAASTEPARAGQLHAIGLISETLRAVVALYREQAYPSVIYEAEAWLLDHVGRRAMDEVMQQYLDLFPPLAVYRGEVAPDAYLDGHTSGRSNRHLLIEDLLLLWLSNVNPAFSAYRVLFDDAPLAASSAYAQVVDELAAFLASGPPFGPDDQSLVAMLRSPAIAVPKSIPGQLEYIRERWGYLLGARLRDLLRGLDVLREESKLGLVGPGPSRVYEYSHLGADAERFSPDLDWMPSLVLIAKNAYVWLDQLSKWHGRHISHLDEVPDVELDILSARGFSGLWLIGLWERSPASQRIKRMSGNPDAVASAYSLKDYVIAPDLGGQEAFENLRIRARARNIRLSADMVPNHVGIDSTWVIDHPDWFIALDRPPFPAYSFNGPDLSRDERVAIYLEDHYYDRSDAAVVFKRVDRWTGTTRYVYHGNDGTSMPWNDTAQLDYLKPEVREAVIQAILHVARMFSIIRFDAAMTLTRQHFQRLWYPEPGTGGDIPSRAEHGLSRAQFDALMPEEFWREVVDRIASEAPDTLLLAEAFWLLEGYFVRTLGMHRVYNSAFMNMLRDEDNAKYRSVIKNTLEFDPQVLKRYVNFMNNPDEETAVNQFGKGDKYFGICTLLATMPGLPMFGHGQLEGLSEKYGMEYRRAYWDETPDQELLRRHEREVTPLLHRRRTFAEVDDFLLFDFYTPQGVVNEDVFAYSNRSGESRGLVIYHNRFADTSGSIRLSAAYAVKQGQSPEGDDAPASLERRSLGDGLGLADDPDTLTVFRDYVGGLEYLRSNRLLHEEGLHVSLGAYQRHVFLDFRQVHAPAGSAYAQLAEHLGGRGAESIDGALREMVLRPVHERFEALVDADLCQELTACRPGGRDGREDGPCGACGGLLDRVEGLARDYLVEVDRHAGAAAPSYDAAAAQRVATDLRRELEAILCLPDLLEQHQPPIDGESGLENQMTVMGTLLSWLWVHRLGDLRKTENGIGASVIWIDELALGKPIADAACQLGLDPGAADFALLRVKTLTRHPGWLLRVSSGGPDGHRALKAWLSDSDIHHLIGIHEHDGILWFNKEAFDQAVWWAALTDTIAGATDDCHGDRLREVLAAAVATADSLRLAADRAGYQVEAFLQVTQSGLF